MPAPASPPRLARALLRRLVAPSRRIDVDLDLAELFARRATDEGIRSARRWYRRQVLGFVLRWRPNGTNAPRRIARTLVDDLHHARRSLAHRPVFTGFVILVLTLGVAANAIVFSAIDAAVFRPLPFPGEDRLYGVALRMPEAGYRLAPTWFQYERWRDGLRTADTVMAYRTRWRSLEGPAGAPDEAITEAVSEELFPELEVRMAVGRPLLADDYRSTAEPVAVIAHEFWQASLGGDPGVLGATLRIAGRPHTIVGIVAPGYRFDFFRADVLFPLRDPVPGSAEASEINDVLVALRDGETPERLAAELAARIEPIEFRGVIEQAVAELEPIRSMHYGWVIDWFGPYAGVVAFVLLLVCANVANLSLEWAANRRRDLAVRAALGAGRVRIARQLVLEMMLLASISGGLAVLLGYQGTRLVLALDVLNVTMAPVIFDARTAWITLATALAVGALTGIPSALVAARGGWSALGGSAPARNAATRRSPLSGRVLVVVQVACSILLLAGAGLIVKTLVRMDRYDPGYDTRGLLDVYVRDALGIEDADAAPRDHALAERLVERLAAVPGVIEVAVSEHGGPLRHNAGGPGGVTAEGAQDEARLGADTEQATYRYVSSRYFETHAVSPVAGRTFASRAAGEEAVAVINEAAAAALWPQAGTNVVGRRLKLGPPESDEPWLTVIGIVPSLGFATVSGGLAWGRPPRVYLPFDQGDGDFQGVLVRAAGEPLALLPALQEATRDVDGRLALTTAYDLDADLREEVASYAVRARILSAFAVFGLVLALMGVYGVVAYGVARRTREIGIRKALGAVNRDVLATVLRESLVLSAIGIVIGLGLASMLTDVLSSQLHGTSPLDPWVFALVAAFTAVVAGAAAWLPARRATRLDPMVALRTE